MPGLQTISLYKLLALLLLIILTNSYYRVIIKTATMEIKKVTVAGSGVLGSQIAFQTAFSGFEVNVFDINDATLDAAAKRIKELVIRYEDELEASEAQLTNTLNRLSYFTDLGKAIFDVDLLIEAVPEDPAIKTQFYKQLAPIAPAKTIFASNSSTMLPSQFAQATGRPKQFAALHFSNEIWDHNIAEIMGHTHTDPSVIATLQEFAKAIGMVPVLVKNEHPGYFLNSLTVPFYTAAMSLLVDNIGDVESIDKTWVIGTGAPYGPFARLDVIGLTTAYNILLLEARANKDAERLANYIKENYIDKGKLGVATGEGFYKYPNPAYRQPDFLK